MAPTATIASLTLAATVMLVVVSRCASGWGTFGEEEDLCENAYACTDLCEYLSLECNAYARAEDCREACEYLDMSSGCVHSMCSMSCEDLVLGSPLENKECLSCESPETSCTSDHGIRTCVEGLELEFDCDCACRSLDRRYLGMCGETANLDWLGGQGELKSDRAVCWCTQDEGTANCLQQYLAYTEEGSEHWWQDSSGWGHKKCQAAHNFDFLGHGVDIAGLTSEVESFKLQLPPLAGGDQGPWECGDSLPCKAGESVGYAYVMVEDAPQMTTLVDCASHPGADIDSVGVYRHDEQVACPTQVEYNAPEPPTCPDYQPGNPAVVSCGANGYVSLAGGYIVAGFAPGVEFLCGDVIEVVEMHNVEDPNAIIEGYKTYVGEGSDCFGGTDCRWILVSDWAVGHDEIYITWEW